MRTVIRPHVFVLVFALLPVSARAQTGPSEVEWFAAGSLAMTISNSGEEFPANPSILRPGIGGSALAAVVATGAFVTPHLGFAGELTLPGEFHVQQTWSRDATTWDSDHRDRSLVGLVLVRTGGRRVQLTGAFGAGNVWSHTETTQRSRPFGRPPTDPPQFTFTSTQAITDLTLVAGAEVNTRLSAHLSLVPAFRLLFVPRDEDNSFDGQLATYLFNIGIGIRVWF
jgi:hypothetical protein